MREEGQRQWSGTVRQTGPSAERGGLGQGGRCRATHWWAQMRGPQQPPTSLSERLPTAIVNVGTGGV